MKNIYEVYRTNQSGTIKGWDIIFVECKDQETLKNMPLFDCVISINDFPCTYAQELFKFDGKKLSLK